MSPVVRTQAHDRLEAVIAQEPDAGMTGVAVLMAALSVGVGIMGAQGDPTGSVLLAMTLMGVLSGPHLAFVAWRSAPHHLRVDLHQVTIERRIAGRAVWRRTIPLADLQDVRVETRPSPQYGVDWSGLVLARRDGELFLPAAEADLPELEPLADELRAMAERAATAAGTPDAVAPALTALRRRGRPREREGPP